MLPIRRYVDSDNSCLFNSIGYVCDKQNFNSNTAFNQRNIILSMLNMDSFNSSILGISKEEYKTNIINPKFWGGGIELSLFSQHYALEIRSIDTATLRIDRYGQNKNYKNCVYILYNGIHYDPLAIQYADSYESTYDNDLDIVIFDSDDKEIENKFITYVASQNDTYQSSNYMNHNMLKCNICNKLCIGQNDAANHLKLTGHDQFIEN